MTSGISEVNDTFAYKRGSSIIKGEKRPPHIRVIRPGRATNQLIIASGGGPAGNSVPVVWIRHPERPRRQPVLIHTGPDDPSPTYSLVRPRWGSPVTEVRNTDDEVVAAVRAHRLRSAVHTRWSAFSATGEPLFSLSERPSDAIWRRTLGLPSRLDGDAFFLSIPGFLAGLVRGPNQMLLRDGTGGAMGTVSFSPGVFSPRDDFSVYLEGRPFPLADPLLAACVIAAMQRTY